MTEKEMDLTSLCREAIAQGSVLLRNRGGILPFSKDDEIAVFGRCQRDFYKSGTGSGGSVHVPYARNLIDGFKNLKEEGFAIPHLNEKLIFAYSDWIKEHPFDNGKGEWAGEPWFQDDMEISEEFLRQNCGKNEKALYVIGRTAGEDKDNKAEEGSYYLTKKERSNLALLCGYFESVALLLNVANIIDLSWIDDEDFRGHISVILFCWHGGMEGGLGAADVLCGKSVPSGKLPDTIAFSISDYPSMESAQTFGGAEDVFYKEDIFVGYRYFSTFAPQKVQFPFGFGLSYTSFSIENLGIESDGAEIPSFSAKIRVENTGKSKGRETVQIYAECPFGSLKKSRRVLCAYKKTPLLNPGESEVLQIEFSARTFAQYDESGIAGFESCWILEKGVYKFFAGNDSVQCSAFENGAFEFSETLCIEKCEKCGTTDESVLQNRIEERRPQEIKQTGDKGIRFGDVVCALESGGGEKVLDEFVAQFDDSELMTLVRGEGMMSRKVTAGIAAAFGGLSRSLHDKYKIPAAGCADGPSGIRLDTGEEASLIPIGTLLACTWNDALVESVYEHIGAELKAKKIDVLLGPGCNIHRSPLGGRNFEYYSEDPLLSGKMAAAAVRGIEKGGAIATIKHFACNNQESSRRFMNAVVSERALREIYLKPFEIAVKEGGAKSVMTSYNSVNGHWASSNYDLIAGILRREWNFSGLVMTDWWAAMNDCIKGGKPTAKKLSELVRARSNLYMVVMNDSADKGGLGDNLESSLKDGTLSRGELQSSAKDVIRFLAKTQAAKSPLRELSAPVKVKTALSAPKNGAKSAEPGETVIWTDGVSACLHAPENANYNLVGQYIKESDDLSQSASNVRLNGEIVGSFSSRSTGGRPLSAVVSQLYLESGWYAISIEHTKPGITVQSLTLYADNKLPPTTEHLFV